MNKTTGYKALVLAIAGVGAMNANGAGLDRSGQDITAFLQDGTYAEAVYTYVDADVSGFDNAVTSGASTKENYVKGNATGNITEKYDFFRYGVKADVNNRVSVGVLYDEPFGAAVQYEGANNFVAQGADATVVALTNGRVPDMATAASGLSQIATGFTALSNLKTGFDTLTKLQTEIAAATNAGNTAQVQGLTAQAQAVTNQILTATGTTNLTDAQAVVGTITNQILTATGTTNLTDAQAAATRLGAAVNVAAVSEAQKGQGTNVEIRTQNLTGLVGFNFGDKHKIQVYGGPALQRLAGEVHLRGKTYQAATGYDAKISTNYTTGWVAGVAYSKPEIALKAALTYRSETEHETHIAEVFPALGANNATKSQPFSVTLPESYNLDFQTGLNPTTLLTAKARYVPWGNFDIRPTLYTQTSNTPIVSYSEDQWSAEIGLGKKISDKLSVSGSVGYDSGAGNPATTLGPIEGYYSVGGGVKYNFTPNWSASLGGKYLKFGDATAQIPTGAVVGEFENNDGFIAGLKIAYQAK